MISATRYPYSDEQCAHLHGIVCAAIRDAKIKFTPLAYAVFYQAAMNGFSCALSDELLTLEKGKTLEYGLNTLYHKYIGESCINNIALLDDITENLHQGSHKIVTITEQSSAVLDQQIDRLDADDVSAVDLASIAGKLKKEVMTLSVSQYVFMDTLNEAQTHINELKEKIASLQQLVAYDQLTGLHSRFAYDEFLKKAIHADTTESLSLVIADIDQFSLLNENFGFHVGDAILRYLAQKMKQTLGNDAFLARFSGKSFVFVFLNRSPEWVMQRVEKARQAIIYSKILLRSTKQEIGSITASFGIAHASEKESEASLQSRAEEATLLSKHQGRNRITQL
ncbi:MAG: hypothetical protein B7X52_02080 [Thiotrichales bacterium 34-46-19]|nr:MAG: hypothetical protein B7X52_02080 [Thiotrichales bacterium 34-46-19]HQT04444.1 GGDEF domain-containing protein [Thiotrichales bacterium]